MSNNKVKAVAFMALLMLFVAMPVRSYAAAQCPSQACPCCKDHAPRTEESREPRRERFDRERFMQDLRAYITREAGLTQQEANAVFPLLFEMKAKLHDLQERISRSLASAARSANERDCQRTLNEVQHMKAKQQKVEAEFMKRMGKAVSSRKLVKVLVADQNFGRDRFRQMMDGRSCGKQKR